MEKDIHDVAPSALWQHQKRGHEALELEMAGYYADAARAWQCTANRAPHPRWRRFARERARGCREKALLRQACR